MSSICWEKEYFGTQYIAIQEHTLIPKEISVSLLLCCTTAPTPHPHPHGSLQTQVILILSGADGGPNWQVGARLSRNAINLNEDLRPLGVIRNELGPNTERGSSELHKEAGGNLSR